MAGLDTSLNGVVIQPTSRVIIDTPVRQWHTLADAAVLDTLSLQEIKEICGGVHVSVNFALKPALSLGNGRVVLIHDFDSGLYPCFTESGRDKAEPTIYANERAQIMSSNFSSQRGEVLYDEEWASLRFGGME